MAAPLLAAAGHPVHVSAAPLFGHVRPHLGPGTPAAIAVAVLVVTYGPALAARLRWRTLLAAGYLAATGWTFALAMVDGWQRGLAGRLTTPFEYLSEVPGVTDIPAMLRGFTGRILDGTADSWTTHVAGHPPGALLVFVVLDRIGLGGGGWAAVVCVLVGASIAVSVPVTLRALGNEAAARTAVPFLVLFPGAIWIGVSADGLFAGVGAAGLALLAVAVNPRRHGPSSTAEPSSRRPLPVAVTAGALLGFAVYLNYGLVLLALPALAILALSSLRPADLVLSPRRPAVLALSSRRAAVLVLSPGRPGVLLGGVLLGGMTVAAAFTAAGFTWLDGYHLVQQRYYQGLASHRPYLYWVWANLAALTLAAGPATAPLLRRALLGLRRGAADFRRDRAAPPGPRLAPVLLPLAAAAAILLADLSGLSKAETERIWLPFAVWLPAGAALLPAGRRWLIAQAATALLVNHLILTGW